MAYLYFSVLFFFVLDGGGEGEGRFLVSAASGEYKYISSTFIFEV